MSLSKHKVKQSDLEAKSVFVKEFEHQIRDTSFQKKLAAADPALREFMNELLKDFKENNLFYEIVIERRFEKKDTLMMKDAK